MVSYKLNPLIALERSSLGEVAERLRDIDTSGILNTDMDVRYRYNLVARFVEKLRTNSAYVSGALNNNSSIGRIHLEPFDSLVDHKQNAPTCGFTSARRSAEIDRLAGDNRGDSVTSVHRVGVHDPGHRLLVGVHVRSRDVFFRSDKIEQLCRVPTSHSLKFAHGHLLRVTNDPALGATERHIHNSALPGHPCRQGSHFIKIHVRRISNPTFCRTSCEIVLYSKSLKYLNATRVHAGWYINF